MQVGSEGLLLAFYGGKKTEECRSVLDRSRLSQEVAACRFFERSLFPSLPLHRWEKDVLVARFCDS